jgi:hypothetical protein
MRNPIGWILGYVWKIAYNLHAKWHPKGGSMWMPRWIQPYWMRCMGWEVNEAVLAFYDREPK